MHKFFFQKSHDQTTKTHHGTHKLQTIYHTQINFQQRAARILK